MVSYNRSEIISATDLARNVSATLNSVVNNEKEKIAISKNNKLEAVIIGIDEYERLKEMSELIEDLEIAKILKEREKTSKSEYITLDELVKELGINLDEL